MSKIIAGIEAGIAIALGGSVFLACDNKYIGACLFTVALLCICYQSYSLYTGKICYVVTNQSKDYLQTVFLGLVGNIIATVTCGILLRLTNPSMHEVASTLCANKLLQNPLTTITKGLFCGILIYLAVEIFNKKNTPIAIIFCIPTFILAGFEHSIADIFYMAVGAEPSIQPVLFILYVLIGNSLGGMLLPALDKLKKTP